MSGTVNVQHVMEHVLELEKQHLARTDELADRCGRLRFLVEFALRRATYLRQALKDEPDKVHIIDALLSDIEKTLKDGLEKANYVVRTPSSQSKDQSGDHSQNV